VAVIGAGISGVTAAAHLLREGLKVTVYERSSISGGVWHFDERTPEDPSYPSNIPSVGDYHLSVPGEYSYGTPPPESLNDEELEILPTKADDALQIRFSPPGPCYAGLRNNVPTSLMVSVLDSWPAGTEEQTNQINLERYIQMLSKNHGVDQVTQYDTRVDEVKKTDDGQRWSIRTITLDRRRRVPQLVERYDEFDGVVVASGHYNLPRIPDTPGLSEWKAEFGDSVIHSKQYRKAEKYRGKNLLVVGAGVSSVDICRELGEVANKIYQSVRGGLFDLPETLLPGIGERVGEVGMYVVEDGRDGRKLGDGKHISGRVVLKDGRELADIDVVILATGYITSYPFLRQLHDDQISATEAGPEVLVTADGEMCHNLHKDIFYIPDPSLSFVGVPYHVATFSLFDFQSQIVARVFAGKAILPSEEEMRKEYEARIREKGAGRSFHSLRNEGGEVRYVQDLVAWANSDAERLGVDLMQGHTREWLEGQLAMKEKMKKLLEGDQEIGNQVFVSGKSKTPLATREPATVAA
jgi:thioredoxin reductase